MASPANARTGDRVDFGRSLGFFFEDPEWLKKLLLGGLFTLLGIVFVGTILVAGYFLRVIRRTARGEPRPLPDWDDWGGLFVDGLVAFGVYLVHALALVIPLLAGGGCLIGLAAAGSSGKGGEGGSLLAGIGVLGIVLLYAAFFVLILALAIYMPAVLTRVAILGRFGAAFEVRENVGFIRRNLGEYLLALVIFLVANFISQFGLILLCVGIFPATFWSYCVLAYPLGQIARRDAVLGARP